jgi:hypothetical protein
MSYLTTTLPQRRVLETGYKRLDTLLRVCTTAAWIVVQVPLHGIKVYMPIFLISLAASFASAQFAAHRDLFPFPLNYTQAIAFEWVYIGTLAMAGVKRGKWFFVVLLSGAVTSVVYIMLYAASRYGLLAQIKAVLPQEAIPALAIVVSLVLILAHSLPLTMVNVVYGFLIHSHIKETAEQQAELDARIYCSYGCGYWSKSEPAVRGHKAQCPNNPKG